MRASKRIINLLIFLFFPSLTFLLFADTYDPLVYAWEPTDNTAFLNVSLNPEPSPLKFDVVAENGSLSVIIDSGTLNITPAGHDVTLSMDSFNTHMSPGDPMVPVRVVHMALPPDADLETLAFSHSVLAERVLNGVYSVAPAPPMATWDGTRTITDWGEDKNIVDNRNINVYGSDAFFVAEVVEPAPYSQLRKWQMAQFAYYPVQYNPVTGKLRIVERIQVDISYKTIAKAQNASNFSLTDDGMEDRAAVIIDNYAQAAPLYTLEGELHPSVDFDYVILTTERIVENSTRLNDFESFKENQGYSVLTVTENARYTSVGGSSSGPGWGGGTGDTAAENIRSWIRNNYLLLGIDYVLLIGNPDPFYGDIPMKMCWPRLGATRYPEYDHAPTDYYYADLTGNWDLDGDGNYGEYYGDFGSGGIDTNVEIYVGRIPIYNPSSIELDLILQKTIEYGTEVGDLGWRKKVLLPMEPSDDLTHAWPLAENIRNEYANPAGWNSYRIYDEDYGKSPEKTPCNATNVQNEWQNRYGLVTWWTHGSITTAVDVFDISSSINLDNAHPSFTFQCSCNNAYPEYEDNLGYSLLVNGAIGTISATRVSWYYVGDSFWEISGGNSYMADRYSKKIIDAVPSGKALFDMKMEASINTEGNWMNFLVFNLYGDPALKIDDAGLSLPPIETIIDNNNAGFTSGPNAWTWSQFTPGGYNTSYQYAPIGSGGKWAKWTFTVSTPGEYEIFAQWTSGDNRSPAAPYTIKNGAKTWKVTANQTRDGGQFNLLGTYPLTAGTLEVYLSDTPTGVVIADAVKIVSEGTPPIKSLDRIEIEGLVSIPENTSQNYLCRVHYTDGTTDLVTAEAWSDDCVDADIDDTGLLTAYEVDGDMTCRIMAGYTAEGITNTASKDVTIIDDDSIKPIEIIIDNKNAEFASGPTAWTWSSFTPGGYGGSYQYAAAGSGWKWAKWLFPVKSPGEYRIFAQWTSGDNRSPAAPYLIIDSARYWVVDANQTKDGGRFNLLGTYPLTAGTLEVYLSDTPTGVVIADAVKIVSEGTPPIKSLDRIEIEGLVSIPENTSQNYLCRAHYTDGTTEQITADTWSDDCVDADIDDTGLLTAYEVDGDMACRITADYTAEGITKTASKDITIIDGDSIKPIEIIIDNKNAGFASGPNAWTWSQFTPGGYNTSYQYAPIGSGSKWAKWTFTVNTPGEYEIFAQWTSGDNRSAAAPYTIKNGANTWTVAANQKRDGGQFNLLGTYPLGAGTLEVMLNDTPTGVVIADAVKIITW